MRKVFDNVNHEILPPKLFHDGVCDIAYELCQSYLNNRYQFVYISTKFSKKLKLSMGFFKDGTWDRCFF